MASRSSRTHNQYSYSSIHSLRIRPRGSRRIATSFLSSICYHR
ncbi:hypothetical protein Prudu_1158S000200 [Prunus dulcis]|uniref:Uncharacterized protein n=1 Tax=Prunus dulcis TaxID=3755 RepID=A0A4Y1RC55_PRUDU|nr:hypothetical protein Prudu_012086 [Prunus dulcis]BBN69757.1 hypothetical protein Prudu_1158S000200 [Prunus dulcis]